MRKENKKGQVFMYALMVVVMIFITAVILTEPLKDMIETARDASHLDCSNVTISTGVKMTCLIVDLYLPYFIGAILFGSLAYLIAKISQ